MLKYVLMVWNYELHDVFAHVMQKLFARFIIFSTKCIKYVMTNGWLSVQDKWTIEESYNSKVYTNWRNKVCCSNHLMKLSKFGVQVSDCTKKCLVSPNLHVSSLLFDDLKTEALYFYIDWSF
jgi:hypothetical protein